ncbi:hypothetical protein ACPB8Q_04255 [Methanocaldococcus indicus]|uniref:hypothetical protein n=1 Tax=Methanocaldococcus indicus TaxID=213231 RepID=UPI003C6D55EA
MEVLELSENVIIIKNGLNVYKIIIDNNEGKLLKLVKDKYVVVEEGFKGDNKEIIEKAKKYIILIEDIKFDHTKNSWVSAVGLDENDLNDIFYTLVDAVEHSNTLSEDIEYIYKKYKDDIRKLIVALIYFGQFIEDSKTKDSLLKIYEFISNWEKSLLYHKLEEIKKEKENKNHKEQGYIR